MPRALRLAPFLAAWLCLPLAAQAAPVDAKTADLQELRERIGSLRRDLARSTESKASVSDQLRATESAISTANRRLRRLAQQRAQTRAGLDRLEGQSEQVASQIETQQRQLSRLLYRQHLSGDSGALSLLLSGEDPNQMARDRHFLILLSRAKAQLLGELRDALAQKKQLAGSIRVKGDELARIAREQEESRAALQKQQQQRQKVLTKISGKIKAQRREIGRLKADEARLSKLIAGLARIGKKTKRQGGKPDGTVLSNQLTPEASAFRGAFAGLRGKLRLPVQGEIANRFGGSRGEGETTWKGIFIRAIEGTEVKAVAAGRVVFADWLRGFGNLMILDHGGGYLSVYGNNQSLFRETGEQVQVGDGIAAVGSSGGNPESGLYFELRQQGQPVDPLKWAALH